MSNDPLTRAVSALRDSYDGASPDAAVTRARVLARAALRRKRRRSVALVLLPLAAAFVMSSAWAAVTGRVPDLAPLLRRALPTATRPILGRPVSSRDSMEDVPLPIAPTPLAAPVAPVASALRVTPVASVETAPRAPVAPAVESPVSARRTLPSSQGSRPSMHAPDAATDVEESLYADAHRAHFVARDPVAALRGWDAYLRTYPDGRFALEARYNRALTLVRLGQVAEARAALAPFADGSTGGYRRREARALLDALDGGP